MFFIFMEGEHVFKVCGAFWRTYELLEVKIDRLLLTLSFFLLKKMYYGQVTTTIFKISSTVFHKILCFRRFFTDLKRTPGIYNEWHLEPLLYCCALFMFRIDRSGFLHLHVPFQRVAFIPPRSFEFIQDSDEKEDAFHFISYVRRNAGIYEVFGTVGNRYNGLFLMCRCARRRTLIL